MAFCREMLPSSVPTTAVLFRKAENAEATPISFRVAKASRPLSRRCVMRSSNTERSSASDTSSSRISVASAGLA